MQKPLKQRLKEVNGERCEIRDDIDFNSPEIYAPTFIIESKTDKNYSKQSKNSQKNVITQSIKNKNDSQKNSSRQPNTTKSATNGNVDLFFKNTQEISQPKLPNQVQNTNNINKNHQVRISKQGQEKQIVENQQQVNKRTVSKNQGVNKSSVQLTGGNLKNKGKKKTISLKGLSNTQTISSDLNTISQMPSDQANIYNQVRIISQNHQHHNQQNSQNGNQINTKPRCNNHVKTTQQLNLLSQNQKNTYEDKSTFYQNQQNNSFHANFNNNSHQNQNSLQNNQCENEQTQNTSNTATFEARGTIDVEDYKIKLSRKNYANQNPYSNQTSSDSKKKMNSSIRKSSRSKSVSKKNQSITNGSMNQGTNKFNIPKQFDLNRTENLNNTNKSFTENNSKFHKTKASFNLFYSKKEKNLKEVQVKERIIQIRLVLTAQKRRRKQIEEEKEKSLQQKKLQLQIDNETIRINNGQRFLKQKAKKDNSQYPWGYNQYKRTSQVQKQQERSQERLNNSKIHNTIKYDDNIRRERLGLNFLNNVDEETMQSLKKRNQEQILEAQAVNNKIQLYKPKTLEEHQYLLAFMEYKKQIQEDIEKQEKEIKEFEKHKIEENLKKLNDTIKRQQRQCRSKSVSKKKSFIISGDEQIGNTYYNIQSKNRSASGDNYTMSRVSSDQLKQLQHISQLVLQNNQNINQPCGDIKIDFNALENEQNSERKFSVLNSQYKNIISQALEDQKNKQKNFDSSVASHDNQRGNQNQALNQNYINNDIHQLKMSSGKTSLHSFITKSSKEMSNQKQFVQESNRNLNFELKKQKIFQQFMNLGQRFQSLHITQQQQHQQQQINPNFQKNKYDLQNQIEIQQQQLEQILQTRQQYENYMKEQQRQHPQQFVYQKQDIQQINDSESEQNQEQIVPDLPSENDIVDERLVIEEFKSSSSGDSEYSRKKLQNNNPVQQVNYQQSDGQIKQGTQNQNQSKNLNKIQDCQNYNKNEQYNQFEDEDNEEDVDYRNIACDGAENGVQIITPLEFNRGNSENISPENQKWGNYVNQVNNPHLVLQNQIMQDAENSQTSKHLSSISNQKNYRSDFMYNQSSQSFHDIKDNSSQNTGRENVQDSSRLGDQNPKRNDRYEDYDEQYEHDEEELKNLQEIRDIEQQALLNSTNVNLNKTNNLSMISNHTLILNNNNMQNKKQRKIVKNPILQYILDVMDGFIQQDAIDEQLAHSIEQMQQAAMLIQKVWKGYYTRIILGYRLEMILQEENNLSYDLTEEQEDEILRMQILQYQIDNGEEWTQDQFQEYFLNFKQKNAIEKEKRRKLRQEMLEAQQQHYSKQKENKSGEKNSNSQRQNQKISDSKQKSKIDQKAQSNIDDRNILHSENSYEIQHIDSRQQEDRDDDFFEEEQSEDKQQRLSNLRGDHKNKNQQITSQKEQMVSLSNKQTDEILNTEDLLMDQEQYIKSAQRYQQIKETQPHLIDHQVDINYDELMNLDINTTKFSPNKQNQRQPVKMNIQYHPIDPRYKSQQNHINQQNKETYDMEESEQNQDEEQEYDDENEYKNDQFLLNLLKQGINLNQFKGNEKYDVQNNKLLIQDGEGVYELDLSKLPGINNLHFKEDQFTSSMKEQQFSGQNFSDDISSFSQRQKVPTKEVGIDEKEYVNFDINEDEDFEDEEFAEVNNLKHNINKEKEFNKVQNVSMKRKVNLGIVIDDDPVDNQLQMNIIGNNLSNQGGKKKEEILQQPSNNSVSQKNNNVSNIPFQKLQDIPHQQLSDKKQELKKVDQTGEKIKQYNNYMENLEFSEKKQAESQFAYQDEDDYDEENEESENKDGEEEDDGSEYDIDLEVLFKKEKYQDEEGNIFIIEKGDKIYLGPEEIQIINEYANQYYQQKRVKEDNPFENDNESDEEQRQPHYEQNYDDEQNEDEDQDYDDEDEEQFENGSNSEAINVNINNRNSTKVNKNNQFILQKFQYQVDTRTEKNEENQEQKGLNQEQSTTNNYKNNINTQIPLNQQEDKDKIFYNQSINQKQLNQKTQNQINNHQNNTIINDTQIYEKNEVNLNQDCNEQNTSNSRSQSQQYNKQQNATCDIALKNISQTQPIQNININQDLQSYLSKSFNINHNPLQTSDQKQFDISQFSQTDSNQLNEINKTKQEQAQQWADLVYLLEEFDQNNPLSIIEQIKLRSQQNIKQLTQNLKNERMNQNMIDSPNSQKGLVKQLSNNQDDNVKTQRSAKKKLVIDVEKIENEFQQKVSAQSFSAQDNPQTKKDLIYSKSQNLINKDEQFESASQDFEDVNLSSKMEMKQFRRNNIDQLISSFHFSAKTLSTPGKQNLDSENEDSSSVTGSLFEAVPFQDFYQKKYRELMKKDDINQLLIFREQALIKRHNYEEKNLKKKLEINRISPRTYDIKRSELEKMITKEREQITKTRSDIERTWNQTAQTIARTHRDLMFLQKMRASQELISTHPHNPHQILMFNMNQPPPLFSEGAEIHSARNNSTHNMYSSTSSSAFKKRRVLFKSESETETDGSWKCYQRNLRYSLNNLKTPESCTHSNIIVIDQYKPIDLSKRNNQLNLKDVNFQKTLGSTLTADDGKSQLNTTERSLNKNEGIVVPSSVSNYSKKERPDESHNNINSEQSERGYSPKGSKNQIQSDINYKNNEYEEYDDDFGLNIDGQRDSGVLEKKLYELNIKGDYEPQVQDLKKDREEFEENYKNLITTEKKNDKINNQKEQIPYDFQLSQEKLDNIFDEKNIYSSSSKLFDASIQKKEIEEEYFQELLQQTPITNNNISHNNTNNKDNSNKQSSQGQALHKIRNFSPNSEECDIIYQSKESSSIKGLQNDLKTINKKLFSKDDKMNQDNHLEDELENLSENKSLEICSSVFQKTPAQILKKRIGEFTTENMFSSFSASGPQQGIAHDKNSLSSIDWDNQISQRQSVDENELKSQNCSISKNNQIQKPNSAFEKKFNSLSGQSPNFLMEELDSNIEQCHMQNANYSNSVQNLCANYHNNYSLSQSINTVSNSIMASQIQQNNQIISSYNQIFPKTSSKSSADKFSDFNYSTSKDVNLNYGEEDNTAEKIKKNDNLQNTHSYSKNQQGQLQNAYIYDIQDDYEIDLEYEASANKQKLITDAIKDDQNIKSNYLSPNTISLQTQNDCQDIIQGKDVSIQNLSNKYDSEVFVDESVEEQEKDIVQLSTLINKDFIANMKPIITVDDTITEESETNEPISMKLTSYIPKNDLGDNEIDRNENQISIKGINKNENDDISYEKEEKSIYYSNKSKNTDLFCDDLVNTLMDEVTEEFSKNKVISQKLKNCSQYLKNLEAEQKIIQKESQNYEHFNNENDDDDEELINEELVLAQKQYGSGTSQNSKRAQGIQTQISAVKNYLTKLSDYIKQNYLDTFVERINNSLGPTAIEMLKFLHFTDQNFSIDSQLDNSSDFSMQHSAVLVTELYSQFEMLLIEEKNAQNNDDSQFNDNEEESILSEQQKVNLKDITHIHNKVIFDAFNEALDNHRLYGLKGRPFPWKIDATKINSTPITHEKVPIILQKSVQKVLEWAECQCGFIFDRADQQIQNNQNLNEEYISQVKEKRLTDMLHQEVKETEEKWIIYDDECTEIQVEISELVIQELLLELDIELNDINNKRTNFIQKNELKSIPEFKQNTDQKQQQRRLSQ